MQDMSSGFAIFIMMNNYFHDVATAMFMASGIVLWVLMRRYARMEGPGSPEYFLRVHAGMQRLARFALWWILIGGVPRVLYYRGFEWANAVEHGQEPALLVKHILEFVFVVAGASLWKASIERVRSLTGAEKH